MFESRKNFLLNSLLFCFFALSAMLGVRYIDYKAEVFRLTDIQRLKVISEQVTSRVQIFSEIRMRALAVIASEWPDNHPNHALWFAQNISRIQNILSGFRGFIWVDSERNMQWQVPNCMFCRDQLKLPIQFIPSSTSYLTESFRLEDGNEVIAVVQPVISNDRAQGWIVGLIDVDVALDFIAQNQTDNNLYFSLFDNDRLLLGDNRRSYDDMQLVTSLPFFDRQLEFVLVSENSRFDIIKAKQLVAMLSLLLTLLLGKYLYDRERRLHSQQRFKAASQSALDGMLIFKKQGAQLFLEDYNPVAEQMLSDVITLNDHCTYHHFVIALNSHSEELFDAPKKVFNGEHLDESFAVELGEIEHLKLQMVKANEYLAVTMRDITPRKHAELALKKREAKYRRLVEGLSGHFIYSLTSQGKLEYVSQSVKQILGYTPEQFIAGANDYIVDSQLNSKRKSFLERLTNQQVAIYQVEVIDANDDLKLLEITESSVVDESGNTLAIEGIAKDITKEKQLADEILFQANHDALTGLYNRYAFDSQLDHLLDMHAKNEGQLLGCMCYIDLDEFKVVNDTSGHIAGDQLLQKLGELISATITDNAVVARLGGDEFGIIFPGRDAHDCYHSASVLLNAINEFRFVCDNKVFSVGASMGLATICSGMSVEAAMKAADLACYKAKETGRNRITIYSETDEHMSMQKLNLGLAQDIQQAIEQNRFVLYRQTIKPLCQQTSGAHYEILVRMLDVQGDLVSPALFIPAAERFSLMPKIDRWVVENTFAFLGESNDFLMQTEKCAINLSGASVTDMSFADTIISLLTRYQIPPSLICFEITETAAVSNISNAIGFIDKLRDFGCEFALDDFGVGMCSFNYLKNLPVDYVKIDGSFVKTLVHDDSNKAIVKAINSIAKSLGKRTIAEFVGDCETEQQLKALSVDYVQGFYIDQPCPLATGLVAQPKVRAL